MGGRSWSTELRSSSGMSSSGWGKLVTIGNPIVCADRHFMEEAKDGDYQEQDTTCHDWYKFVQVAHTHGERCHWAVILWRGWGRGHCWRGWDNMTLIQDV